MVVFLYFIEINGFGNFRIDYINSTEYKFTEYIFTVHKIKNEDLQNIIEDIFNDVIKNVKIQQLYLFEFWFGDNFLFLGIQFHSDNISPLEMIDKINKASDDLLKKLQASEKIKLNIYYVIDIYLDHNITYYIEDLLKKEIEKKYEIIASYPLFNLSYSPFTLKISSRYNIEYLTYIKTGIKECFEKSFPHSLDHIPINCFSYVFNRIFTLTDKDWLNEKFFSDLLRGLAQEISILYSNLIHPLSRLRQRLPEFDKVFKTYDQKTLEGLKAYFKDLYNVLFGRHNPWIFFHRIDLDISQYLKKSKQPIKPIPPYHPYSTDLIDYFKLINNELPLLEKELDKTFDKISILIFQKEDRIRSFTKKELFEKLNSIKKESEYQDLLAQILKDLGFIDVIINCGRRGHKEYGKDIVFSHRNKFGHLEWSAIVVKKGKIQQKESESIHKYIEKIIDQGSLALDIEYEDEKGVEFPITRVFVATNEEITDPAKKVILRKIKGSVFFIERQTLLELI